MANKVTDSDIVMVFLNTQAQLKLLHWQTTSFAAHKAYEEAYNKLDGLFDTFIEAYQGLFNKRIEVTNGTMEVVDINEVDFPSFIVSLKKFLSSNMENEVTDASLLHLLDEMLSVINKLQYLLTLE